MKRLLLGVVSAVVLSASAAYADVTVTMSMAMVGGPMAVDGSAVTYLKGTKGRTDMKMAGQNMSVYIDAASKQQWAVNHVARQIEALDLQKAMAGMPMDFGAPTIAMKPNGQTKDVLGRTCQGYLVEMTMPLTINGEAVTLKMVGPMWVAKEGAGIAEYWGSQKALADVGLALLPMSQGPQGKAMVELQKQMLDAGVVLEQEQTITMEGSGQMAQVLAQMGTMTSTMKVTAISTDPIPDDKFALPEGYTKK
jgi:opacity protein-like surface antigen